MTKQDDDYLPCSVKDCGRSTGILRREVPEEQWKYQKCPEHREAQNNYGHSFINWVQNRISDSNVNDSSGRFVLRELVQNADDEYADILILEFTPNALLVYNNGEPFDTSDDPEVNDFDRISNVLGMAKAKKFQESGNFGSGFQTVYLFTNYPEVHSSGNSFRFDPIQQRKFQLIDDQRIISPFCSAKVKKGAVFRLPWRTSKNAIVKDGKRTYFHEESPWKRWDENERRELYNELVSYAHDALLCCQRLKAIRLLWGEGRNEGYQAERDFTLSYVSYDGRIGTIIEGKGEGKYLPDDWIYEDKREFRYFIGSKFVEFGQGSNRTPCLIVDQGGNRLSVKKLDRNALNIWKRSEKDYINDLEARGSRKKSDVHVLIPLYPWTERVPDRARKAWSYSVIPLPSQCGNNFITTAHLFPRENRTSHEVHQDPSKREWLKVVLISLAELYVRTYGLFVDHVRSNEKKMGNEIKQSLILDYLPDPSMTSWVGVDDNVIDREVDLRDELFGQVFSQRILFARNNWYPMFTFVPEGKGKDRYQDVIDYPRGDAEERLIRKMGFLTYSNEFRDHPRVLEIADFKERIIKLMEMSDQKFIELFGSLDSIGSDDDSFIASISEEGELPKYPSDDIDKELIEGLLDFCLLRESATADMGLLPIIPNAEGELRSVTDLRRETNEHPSIGEIIPDELLPHPHFKKIVKDKVPFITDPREVFQGLEEKKTLVEKAPKLFKDLMNWLEKSTFDLSLLDPSKVLMMNSLGHLVPLGSSYWVPPEEYDVLSKAMAQEERSGLVHRSMLNDHFNLAIKRLKIPLFDFRAFLEEHFDEIDGPGHGALQRAVLRGLLLGLEQKDYELDDLKNLRMIPVDEMMMLPTEVCVGSTLNEKIDRFISCVDKPIQELISSQTNGYSTLIKLGCGDATGRSIECCINAIDRMSTRISAKDGEAWLTEGEHKDVVNVLKFVNEKDHLMTIKSMSGKRCLPARYRNRITLVDPPGYTDNRKEIDRYNKDWVWQDQRSLFPDELAPVMDGIHMLALGTGNKKLEDDIVGSLKIQDLLSGGRLPRGISLMFLAPKTKPEDGLFFRNALERHIGRSLTDDEFVRIRKALLTYLREYFRGSAHITEQMAIDKSPCLYDVDGIWRYPQDFTLDANYLLPSLGTYQLHPELNEGNGWDTETLRNLGVMEKIDFSKLRSIVKGALESPNGKERDEVLLKVLSTGIKGTGTKDDWKTLSNEAWIPTRGGYLRTPKEALVPPSELLEYTTTIDLPDVVGPLAGIVGLEGALKTATEEDLSRMSLRSEANSSELLQIWMGHMKKGLALPSSFFDLLEDHFKNDGDGLKNVNPKQFMYCHEGKWVDPLKVMPEDPAKLPEALREGWIFTNDHPMLLGWLRGDEPNRLRKGIDIPGVLELLGTQLSIEARKEIWDYLVSHREEIGSAHAEKFRDVPLFEHEGRLFRPRCVVIMPRGGTSLNREGTIGDWISVGNTCSETDIATLRNLGANELNDLLNEKEQLESFLQSLAVEIEAGDVTLIKDVIRMFHQLADLDKTTSKDIAIVPIKEGRAWRCLPMKELILPDKEGLWKLFKDDPELTIFTFEDETWKAHSGHLKEWMRKCGATPFNEVLISKEIPTMANAVTNEGLTYEIRSLAKALVDIVDDYFETEDSRSIRNIIGPMQTCVVHTVKGIPVSFELKVDGRTLTRRQNLHYYYPKDGVHNDLYIDTSNDDHGGTVKELFSSIMRPRLLSQRSSNIWDAILSGMCTSGGGRGDVSVSHPEPSFDHNLQALEEWWTGELACASLGQFPILEGDFWWSALGHDLDIQVEKRRELLKASLFNDRDMMFGIFSVATLLSENVNRKSIEKFIDHLMEKGLSFKEIYKMDENEILNRVIDDAIDADEVDDGVHPRLRSKMMDIMILKRVLADDDMGQEIIDMLKELMIQGDSPETYLRKGTGYSVRPLTKGFNGMFTGQIYFMVREAYRLGIAPGWKNISFNAPRQVRELLVKIGFDMPSRNDEMRERLAKDMVENIGPYEALSTWRDVPFFVYHDQFCSKCHRKGVPNECILDCYVRSRGWAFD